MNIPQWTVPGRNLVAPMNRPTWETLEQVERATPSRTQSSGDLQNLNTPPTPGQRPARPRESMPPQCIRAQPAKPGGIPKAATQVTVATGSSVVALDSRRQVATASRLRQAVGPTTTLLLAKLAMHTLASTVSRRTAPLGNAQSPRRPVAPTGQTQRPLAARR